ncbi:preprotein translocase subunit SecE [Candidatus Proelusimicrobium excrementi]|uniref:preprotein translocase subunit SecE n=1 Tax=Candidatus Proelusimicrobium excrementi TaxID=3416222 RepID=UPI003CBC169D|nr:preprotein translocase subunit SecE [Elusimicrobiaceae bacterium]MDD6173539.1 preprotein translocase subunit SecE [Elusimicrobiota bacterium]
MNKAISFLRESYFELKKSVWLSRAQMIQSTIFVFIVVAIISIYISGIDFILSSILGKIIGGN